MKKEVEHLIRIHDVTSLVDVEAIIKKYINDGFHVTKVEHINEKRYTFYLEKHMGYYLFLDDIRKPTEVKWINLPLHNYTIVRNYNEFVDTITKANELPKFIAFDHDLADEHYGNKLITTNSGTIELDYIKNKEKTGLECAKWLVEYCRAKDLDIPPYVVHSMNPVGKDNIIRYLENYKLWRIQFKS